MTNNMTNSHKPASPRTPSQRTASAQLAPSRLASSRPASLRPVGLGGLVWGAVLLSTGPRLFRTVQGRSPSRGEQIAIVVLGVRHAAQGLIQVLAPHHLARAYAALDALHALSMLSVAALQPQRRRAALLSAALAVSAGAAAFTVASHPDHEAPA